MVTPRERIDAVLNHEDPIDRLPRFEIGAVTLPLTKLISRYYKFPPFMKKALRYFDLIPEMIAYLKKFYLGIELNKYKPKKIVKIFPKRLLTNFVNLSRTDEDFGRIFKTIYRAPIRLGYDAWGFPDPLLLQFLGKIFRKEKGEYGICFADGKIWDLDLETGDMIEVGLLSNDPEVMMKYFTNFMRSFDFERHYGAVESALNQKIGGDLLREQIVPIIFIRGLVSTWFYIFPLAGMNKFFRYVLKEYRNKGEPGIYGRLLREKTKFLKRHVDYLAKLKLPALLMGDDQAETHGPFFNTPVYAKVFKPCYTELTRYAHSKGIKVILHSDGRFKTNRYEDPPEEGWDFIDECILKQGVDAWHSVEAGANDVHEIKEHIGRRLTLFGSIDTEWLQYHDPPTVRRLVFKHLKGFLKRGGLHGFVPGSDNSIVNATRIESWLSMIRTIDDFSAKYIK